jgi:hypothetical protein
MDLDTFSTTGKVMLGILGSVAEFIWRSRCHASIRQGHEGPQQREALQDC